MIGRFRHERLNQCMAEHGWIITGVPGKALYTIGLSARNHPELMIHGMSAHQSGSLLTVAALRVLSEGYVYASGLHDNIAEGFPAKLIDVHPSNFGDWLGQALDYVGPRLKVLQILWCDTEGKFPGDAGFDRKFAHQLRFDVRRPEYDVDLTRIM